MIEVVYCMRRKAELTRQQFLSHWAEVHAPIVLANLAALRLAGYERIEPLDHAFSSRVERRQVMAAPYDGVARLTWASEEDMRHAFESADALSVQRRLAADEMLFVDAARSCRWVAAAVRHL